MENQMLTGKVAIITGASYGMGRTMAELFADEGAAVVITARHAEHLNEVVEGIKAKGQKSIGIVADIVHYIVIEEAGEFVATCFVRYWSQQRKKRQSYYMFRTVEMIWGFIKRWDSLRMKFRKT